MKNVNIVGIHQFLGEGGQKKTTIYMRNCLKRGAWQKVGRVILRGGGVNTSMYIMT